MNTSLDIKTRASLGWGPSLGYLLTMIGGLAVTAVGCRENTPTPEPATNVATAVAAEPQKVTTPGGEAKIAAPENKAQELAQAPAVTAAPAVATPKASASTAEQNPSQDKPAALEVKRFVVTSGIENREPLNVAETLTLGEPVYGFAELVSGKGGPAAVEIVFEHESGSKAGYAKLDVPADKVRWRTWGQSRRVNKLGTWSAVLLDSEQNELSRVKFEVVAPAATSPAEPLQGS